MKNNNNNNNNKVTSKTTPYYVLAVKKRKTNVVPELKISILRIAKVLSNTMEKISSLTYIIEFGSL